MKHVYVHIHYYGIKTLISGHLIFSVNLYVQFDL